MKLQPGISALCACKNRTKNLSIAIESWLKHPEIDEIIIVDWDSDESLDAIAQRSSKIKIISVQNEPHWELTRAYNLAARFATRCKILKLDCDYILGNNVFKNHPLEDKSIFYAGDWRKARNDNEIHLSGFLFVHTEKFLEIHGYNEIIKGWGYDDDDIYNRLAASGLTRKDICNDDIHHIEHIRSKNRLQGFVRLLNHRKNIFASGVYNWSQEGAFSEYTLLDTNIGNHVSVYFPKSDKKRLQKLRNEVFLIMFKRGTGLSFWKKLFTSQNKIRSIKKIISWVMKA